MLDDEGHPFVGHGLVRGAMEQFTFSAERALHAPIVRRRGRKVLPCLTLVTVDGPTHSAVAGSEQTTAQGQSGSPRLPRPLAAGLLMDGT
jgi:hypothetical protein